MPRSMNVLQALGDALRILREQEWAPTHQSCDDQDHQPEQGPTQVQMAGQWQ